MADRHAGAVATLASFIEANNRQDAQAMKACLTRSSVEGGGFSGPMPPTIELKMHDPEADSGDGRVVIPVTMHLAENGADGPAMDRLMCIMVQEDGVWKFDLASSVSPQMEQLEAAMGEAMQQLGEAMGGAMQSMGDAIEAAMGSGSGQCAAGPSRWEEADEFPREEELSDLPDLVPLLKTTFGVSDKGGRAREARKVPAVASVRALMDQLGDDRPTVLMDLDGSLWAGLSGALDAAREEVPEQAARLRRVRIEPADDWMQRCLVLDGPELVYRLDLRDEREGRYSKEELAVIVPGVLAGMPPSEDGYPEGRTSLPTAGAPFPGAEHYRSVIAPRWMKRICEILEWPIALEADWSDVCDSEEHARAMCLWGLNRVAGALALAFPEGGESRPGAGWLSLIRLTSTYGMASATFENAELTLQITPTLGEKGSLYEHQIRDVLSGRG